jgi:hypothetical protein
VNRQSSIACPDGRADEELGGVGVSWQPALLCYCYKLGWMPTAGKISVCRHHRTSFCDFGSASTARPTVQPQAPTHPDSTGALFLARGRASNSPLTTDDLNFFSRFFVKSLTFIEKYRLILQISVNQSNLNGFSLTLNC